MCARKDAAKGHVFPSYINVFSIQIMQMCLRNPMEEVGKEAKNAVGKRRPQQLQCICTIAPQNFDWSDPDNLPRDTGCSGGPMNGDGGWMNKIKLNAGASEWMNKIGNIFVHRSFPDV